MIANGSQTSSVRMRNACDTSCAECERREPTDAETSVQIDMHGSHAQFSETRSNGVRREHHQGQTDSVPNNNPTGSLMCSIDRIDWRITQG